MFAFEFAMTEPIIPPIPLTPDRSFDPTWLVTAIRRYCPSNPELAEAAARCIRYLSGTELYVHFVSSEDANVPGAEWQHDYCQVLEETPYGEVVLDILKDGRIGGIEFLHQVYRSYDSG